MRGANSKEKPPAIFVSRGIIIIVILAAASFSFLLGFFVGKITVREQPNIRPLPAADASLETTNQVPPQGSVRPQDVAPLTEKATPQGEAGVKESSQKQQPRKIIYTVQVGAFENTSEADALKARLDKKGYKAYVTAPGPQGNGKLYKVRLGEFTSKQEAEVLSKKIKKSMGLQTFVTFKTE